MKKLVSVVVAVMMLFAFTSVAFAAVTDIAGHWAAADIQALINKGVVSGDDTGKFNPEGKLTREQYAKMVVLAKGLAVENPATATFSDVPKTAWSYGYVEAAAKAGLIKGFDGKFNPAANITRQDVAVIVARALNLDTTGTPNFTDAASIASYAKGSVAGAAAAGIVKGADGKFNPTANATRAEAAVMTLRQVNYVAPVAANLMTELNAATAVIGDKTYDLAGSGAAVDYMIGSQLVTKDALLENTKVSFSLNASGKISKLVGDAPDYTYAKGEVTAVGDDGDAFVIVNGKKVYLDNDDNDYYYAEIDEDDNFSGEVNPGPAALTVGKDYLVVYNAKNFASYVLKLASNKTTGTLDSKGEDADGNYLVIDGKKYYVLDESPWVQDLDGNKWGGEASLAAFLDTLKAGDRIEYDTNSKDEITKAATTAFDIEGTTGILQVKKTGSKYDIWLPVSVKKSDNYLTKTYIHEEITDEDEVDAIDEMVVDDDVYTVASAPVGNAVTLPNVNMDTDAKTYLNGTKVNLFDIKKSAYLSADLNDDATQKVTKVTVKTGAAFGIVDSIEKASDKVVSVTVNGTKFPYVGKSDKRASATKGYVSSPAGTGNVSLETGYFVIATTNTKGEILAFGKILDADEFDATVSAVAGQLSHYSENEDSSKKIYVPEDVVEVKLANGAYAWVTFDDDFSDNAVTSMSIAGTKDFSKFVVGSKVYVQIAASDTKFDDTTANAFDTTVVKSAYGVRYDDDTNTLTIKDGVTTVGTYVTNVAGLVFQK